MAHNFISIRLIKTLCKDSSKDYVNSVSMAQNIRKKRFDGSKNYFKSVSMAQNIISTAGGWLKI